jgi:2-haloalkanoic acid dehalogenase type II
MDRQYDIVTFDCYGTLIDWESGISKAFLDAAKAEGVELDRDAVLRVYAEQERSVEEEYDLYRNVLTEASARVARQFGWTPKNRTFLTDSLPSWTPFPDTNPALERLRDAGYQLAILSNTDNDLLAATRQHFTVDFDLIVTAEMVRSYKPARGHFEAAGERIGDLRWLHAAQSNFHDIVPVNAFGVDTAWVNRRGQAALPGGTPTYEVPDMAGLAELLTT